MISRVRCSSTIRTFYKLIRDGVPVSYRDAQGASAACAGAGDRFPTTCRRNNRFLAVRELKITGLRTPNYNRRADLVCFVNGLPLVFIELKAVYKNIRAGFDGNLRDYLDENVIAHAFHHNAFLIVSNGHRARYGSITSAVGAFRRMEAAGRAGQGQRGGRGAAQRHAGARSGCWTSSRTSSCSTPARPGRRARWWRATIRCWG